MKRPDGGTAGARGRWQADPALGTEQSSRLPWGFAELAVAFGVELSSPMRAGAGARVRQGHGNGAAPGSYLWDRGVFQGWATAKRSRWGANRPAALLAPAPLSLCAGGKEELQRELEELRQQSCGAGKGSPPRQQGDQLCPAPLQRPLPASFPSPVPKASLRGGIWWSGPALGTRDTRCRGCGVQQGLSSLVGPAVLWGRNPLCHGRAGAGGGCAAKTSTKSKLPSHS